MLLQCHIAARCLRPALFRQRFVLPAVATSRHHAVSHFLGLHTLCIWCLQRVSAPRKILWGCNLGRQRCHGIWHRGASQSSWSPSHY